jgi:uncharacterized protein (TIGR02996 family)
MLDSPEWLALCRAVVEQPADDLPRLMAADWLEERGQPERAEFIRVQVELASDPTPALYWRERALWNGLDVGTLWPMDMAPSLTAVRYQLWPRVVQLQSANSPETHIRFHRGFPDSVITAASHWLEYGYELVPQYPIRTMRFQNCQTLREHEWWLLPETLTGVAVVHVDHHTRLANELLKKFESAKVLVKMPGERAREVAPPPTPESPISMEIPW